ncbi:hypothetical protein ACRAWF_08200 [Streptomyces sp. L7]
MAARRVMKPLRRLMAGRTTIMITHDLNLAPDADRILVVDRGRIVETGRHDELMARGGAYSRLHRSQNNAVMDTGELRLPLFAEAGVQYAAPPVFVESWAPQPQQMHQAQQVHQAQPVYQPAYVEAEYASDPLFGPMPTTLPDGRPLFRDEVPWSGI